MTITIAFNAADGRYACACGIGLPPGFVANPNGIGWRMALGKLALLLDRALAQAGLEVSC
jgi:hypothetical protein